MTSRLSYRRYLIVLPLLLFLLPTAAFAQPVAVGTDGVDLDAKQQRLQQLYDAYELGLDALQRGDHDVALREFRAAAEAGLDVAQYNLGVMYYSGIAVSPDFSRAYYWLEQAAGQGHRNAAHNLGVLYFNGQGVDPRWMSFWPLTLINRQRNLQQAAYWYEFAANRGHGGAQYNLATMYLEGWGVAADPVLAFKWAWAARESDYPAASALVARLQRELSRTQVEAARARYATWELSGAPGF